MVNKINSTEMGSVIVTILAMLVLISLGVGMVMMFSTSSLQVAEKIFNYEQRFSVTLDFAMPQESTYPLVTLLPSLADWSLSTTKRLPY